MPRNPYSYQPIGTPLTLPPAFTDPAYDPDEEERKRAELERMQAQAALMYARSLPKQTPEAVQIAAINDKYSAAMAPTYQYNPPEVRKDSAYAKAYGKDPNNPANIYYSEGPLAPEQEMQAPHPTDWTAVPADIKALEAKRQAELSAVGRKPVDIAGGYAKAAKQAADMASIAPYDSPARKQLEEVAQMNLAQYQQAIAGGDASAPAQSPQEIAARIPKPEMMPLPEQSVVDPAHATLRGCVPGESVEAPQPYTGEGFLAKLARKATEPFIARENIRRQLEYDRMLHGKEPVPQTYLEKAGSAVGAGLEGVGKGGANVVGALRNIAEGTLGKPTATDASGRPIPFEEASGFEPTAPNKVASFVGMAVPQVAPAVLASAVIPAPATMALRSIMAREAAIQAGVGLATHPFGQTKAGLATNAVMGGVAPGASRVAGRAYWPSFSAPSEAVASGSKNVAIKVAASSSPFLNSLAQRGVQGGINAAAAGTMAGLAGGSGEDIARQAAVAGLFGAVGRPQKGLVGGTTSAKDIAAANIDAFEEPSVTTDLGTISGAGVNVQDVAEVPEGYFRAIPPDDTPGPMAGYSTATPTPNRETPPAGSFAAIPTKEPEYTTLKAPEGYVEPEVSLSPKAQSRIKQLLHPEPTPPGEPAPLSADPMPEVPVPAPYKPEGTPGPFELYKMRKQRELEGVEPNPSEYRSIAEERGVDLGANPFWEKLKQKGKPTPQPIEIAEAAPTASKKKEGSVEAPQGSQVTPKELASRMPSDIVNDYNESMHSGIGINTKSALPTREEYEQLFDSLDRANANGTTFADWYQEWKNNPNVSRTQKNPQDMQEYWNRFAGTKRYANLTPIDPDKTNAAMAMAATEEDAGNIAQNAIGQEIATRPVAATSPIKDSVRASEKYFDELAIPRDIQSKIEAAKGKQVGEKNLVTAMQTGRDPITAAQHALEGEGVYAADLETQTSKAIVPQLQALGMTNPESLMQLNRYLFAKHALEVRAAGFAQGKHSNEAYVSGAANIAAKNPNVVKAAEAIHKWRDAIMDLAAEEGMVKPEVLAGLRKKYPEYVRMSKVMEDFGGGVRGGGSGVIQELSGSTAPVVNPVLEMLTDSVNIYKKISQNRVMKALYGAAEKNVPELENVLWIPSKKKAPGQESAELGDEGAPRLTAYIDGEEKQIAMHKDLYDVFKKGDYQSPTHVQQAVIAFAQMLRSGVTDVPGFALRQLAKDSVNAWWQSGTSAPSPAHILWKGAVQSISEKLKTPEAVKVQIMHDITGANVFSPARLVSTERSIQSVMEMLGGEKPKGGALLSTMAQLAKFSQWTEEFARKGTWHYAYKDALKAGASKRDAAFAASQTARDIMDFATGGTVTRKAKPYWSFLGAYLASIDKLYRTLKGAAVERNPAPFVKLGMVSVGMGAASYLLNEKSKAYWQAPKDLLRKNFVIGQDDGSSIVWPRPDGLAGWGSYATEMLFRDAAKKNPQLANDLATALASDFIPGSPGLANAFAAAAGWDLYRFRNVEDSSVSDLPLEYRSNAYTSLAAKKGAKAIKAATGIGVSPMRMDAVNRSLTGTLGGIAVQNAIDPMIAEKGEQIPGLLPGESVEGSFLKKMVYSPFYREAGQNTPQQVTDFYEAYQKASQEATASKRGLAPEYKSSEGVVEKMKPAKKLLDDLRKRRSNAKTMAERDQITQKMYGIASRWSGVPEGLR